MPPRIAATRRRLTTATLVAATVSALTLTAMPAGAAPSPAPTAAAQAQQAPSARDFAQAAARHGVPRDLLVAVGWSETHLDGHNGAPSQAHGFGVMHLVEKPRATGTLGEGRKKTTAARSACLSSFYPAAHPRRRRRRAALLPRRFSG
ncbi:hypothetical protein [Streptomyces griseoflavus]|uniref:hypothetical protein n=1 Tax=Streptomyces griseoflavus TaxID=35619 RepID=UPI0001B51EB7